MPDETKVALTDGALPALVRPKTLEAVRHCLPLSLCASRMLQH